MAAKKYKNEYLRRTDNVQARFKEVMRKAAKILELREKYGVAIGDLARRFGTTNRTIQSAMTLARKNARERAVQVSK